MIRKLLAILLALIVAASLVACNNEEEETTENNDINIPVESGSEDESGSEGQSNQNNESDTEAQGSEFGTGAPVDENPEDADFVENDDTVYIIHPNGAVKLHGEGDTDDTSLPNGSELQRIAVSESGEWSKVVYNENTYFVYSVCLTTLADLDEGFVEVDKTLVLAQGVTSLSVRNTPSMDNHVVGYVYADTEIVVVAENTESGWYKVEYLPYGSETVAYGYIASDAKWYAEGETDGETVEATEEPTVEPTEAPTEAPTESAGK